MVTVSETCSLRTDLLHVLPPTITAMSEQGHATHSKVQTSAHHIQGIN